MDALLPGYDRFAVDSIKQGAAIAAVTNLDPMVALTTSVAIPVDAPHPNAARLFANWLVSPPGLRLLCGDGAYAAVIQVPGCPPVGPYFTPAMENIPQAEVDQIVALLGR